MTCSSPFKRFLPVSLCLVPVGVLLLASSAVAQRSRDYTPGQFVSVLNGLGYPVGLTDEIDAPNVKQAIRDFQLRYRLSVTGTMTPASQDQAATIVQALQSNLNRLLRPAQALPGNQYYGSQTESFVKVFQERNRLPITGLATVELRQRLAQALLNSPPPTRSSQTSAVPATASSPIPPLPAAAVPTVARPATPTKVLPAVVQRPVPTPPRRAIVSPIPPVEPLVKPKPNTKFGGLYTEREFRQVLQGLGYDINPQKFLSDASAVVALQHFQARYGLAMTGTADQATQAMARKILRVLQYNLTLALGRDISITEYYDDATAAAVKEFQQRNRLRADGIATVSVRQAIDNQAKQKLQ